MAEKYAFVTLLTSDAYLPGALALAAALKDLHPSPAVPPEVDFDLVCLVTPEIVDVSSIKLLRRAFNIVVGVEVIGQQDQTGLQLLGRPDLDTVLTKLHVFRLTQYSKIIFLDADVLPLRSLSHLFTIPHEFSAVPDVGWPDIFNSGVLVLSPGEDKFSEINQLLKSKGSWDGGDQGILNEWRGGNWNRLSFTYNTTPTAAYTYAPAYERFGSQISAIHFIGPNKPWKSIAYRTPFSGSQHAESSSDPQRAYDYNSLVDRWYNVYDKHYRAETMAPEAEFEIHHYASAWDDTPTGAEMAAPPEIPSGSALGLEDLRRLAIEGVTHFAPSVDVDKSGEGEYRSMPLEGRVHLLRPRPVLEAMATSGSPTPVFQERSLPQTGSSPRMATLPTPGPHEYPPSPYLAPLSLPNSAMSSRRHSVDEGHQPSHEDPPLSQYPSYLSHGPQTQSHQNQGDRQHEHHFHGTPQLPPPHQDRQPHYDHPVHQDHSHDHDNHSHRDFGGNADNHHEHQHHHHHHHEQRQEKPRPPSPPMLIWNPALDPPPNDPPKATSFPTDTYFPNIWDQTPSKHNDQPHPVPHSQHGSGGFFQPPPTTEIPEELLREGHYRNILGDKDSSRSAAVPDLTKVKSVFPWENKPRHMPGRVFPASESPLPSQFLQPEAPATSPPPETPAPTSPDPQPYRPPAIYGLPPNLAFANAWDAVPSIQKYASRLVRPPPAAHPPPVALETVRRKRGESFRSWDERLEQSSRDGDDEDEGEEEENQHEPIAGKWDEESENEGSPKTTPKARSRTGSISAGYLVKGKRKDYRTRAVQTTPREMRSQAVQVSTESPKILTARLPEKKSSRQSSSPSKRTWSPATVSTVLQPITTQNMMIGPEATATPMFSSSPTGQVPSPDTITAVNLPSGIHSPREFNFPTSPPPGRSTPRGAQTPIAKPRSPPSPTQAIFTAAKAPSDTSSGTSAPSSAEPVSPPEAPHPALPPTPARKAGRVWDPARGVELFKRGSEEVLARFLRMGSWEEEIRRSPEV